MNDNMYQRRVRIMLAILILTLAGFVIFIAPYISLYIQKYYQWRKIC